jgi:hypothetical protein
MTVLIVFAQGSMFSMFAGNSWRFEYLESPGMVLCPEKMALSFLCPFEAIQKLRLVL